MGPRIFPTILFSRPLAEFLPQARWVSPTDASSVEIVSWPVTLVVPLQEWPEVSSWGNNLGE